MVNVGNRVVEEANERAHEPALGLALFAEEKQVVAGDEREIDFGNDGVIVADDAGEEVFAGLEHTEEIVTDFLLDGFGNPAAGTQLGKGRGSDGGRLHADVSL